MTYMSKPPAVGFVVAEQALLDAVIALRNQGMPHVVIVAALQAVIATEIENHGSKHSLMDGSNLDVRLA